MRLVLQEPPLPVRRYIHARARRPWVTVPEAGITVTDRASWPTRAEAVSSLVSLIKWRRSQRIVGPGSPVCASADARCVADSSMRCLRFLRVVLAANAGATEENYAQRKNTTGAFLVAVKAVAELLSGLNPPNTDGFSRKCCSSAATRFWLLG